MFKLYRCANLKGNGPHKSEVKLLYYFLFSYNFRFIY